MKLKNNTEYAIIGCVHFPYHNKRDLAATVEYLHKRNIKNIILNGDIADLNCLSSFRKSSTPSFNVEFPAFLKYLKELCGQFGTVIYQMGNHERRVKWYEADKTLTIDSKGSVIKILKGHMDHYEFDFSKIKFHDAMDDDYESIQPLYVGKLPIIHGDELNIKGYANPATKVFAKTHYHCAANHFHATDRKDERNIRGDVMTVACLGTYQLLSFSKYNSWTCSFGIVTADKTGLFDLSVYRVVNGKVYQ